MEDRLRWYNIYLIRIQEDYRNGEAKKKLGEGINPQIQEV